MYTSALLGTAVDERHIWYARQQQRLEAAEEQDVDADVPALCGEATAVHEGGQPEQQPLVLVPIRAYNVSTLAEFLANGRVCETCQATVVEDTGFDWDDYEGEFTVNDACHLEPPDWVTDTFHVDGVGQVRDQWYEQAPTADDQNLQEALNAAVGRVQINKHGTPMHLFKRGDGRISLCGTGLDDIPVEASTIPVRQGLFPADDNYDTLGALLDDWLPERNAPFCTECALLLAEETDVLSGLTRDALEKYARQHYEGWFTDAVGDGSGSQPQHLNARCDIGSITDAQGQVQGGVFKDTSGQQGLDVGQQVEFNIDVEGQVAERVKRLFGDWMPRG